MKSIQFYAIILAAMLFGYQCNNLSTGSLQTQTVTATAPSCFNCHGQNTLDSNKLQWAQAGWRESVHANGIRAPIFASYWSGTANMWFVAGYEWHGSDAFYCNGQGCQVCHTKEGFLKKINGDYGTVNWLSTSPFYAAIGADSITNPSELTCFTCHAPHERGNFTLTVDPATTVTTQTGAVYNKTKGSLCANCHQIRLGGYASANEYIFYTAKLGNLKATSGSWGPHHGPQTDVLLGKGGAEYSGKTYTPTSPSHTTEADSNCVNCHMADDFANLTEILRYGLSPAVGGHSMAVAGIVHGTPTANKAGCTFTGCHSLANLTARRFGASGAMAASGYLPKNRAYIDKIGGGTSAAYYAKINGLLKVLADPNPLKKCGDTTGGTGGGLLQATINWILSAGNIATQTTKINWTTMPDGSYGDSSLLYAPTCIHSGFSANLPADATLVNFPADLYANAKWGKFAQALWNFKLVYEDKSLGIHNPTYILQLLYDSCTDLVTLTGSSATYDCSVGGLIPTRP